MAESSLKQTNDLVKKYGVYFGVLIIVVILLQLCLNFINSFGGAGIIEEDFYPFRPVTAEENREDIVLPEIESISISNSSNPIFNVDRSFDELGYNGVNLFAIEEPTEKFTTETKAKDIAAKFGFAGEFNPEGNKLVWTQRQRFFEFDKVTQELSFSNPFVRPDNNGFSNNEDQLKAEAEDLVRSLGLGRPDLNSESPRLSYLNRIGGGEFESANSPATAEFLQIDVYRNVEAVSLAREDLTGDIIDGADQFEPVRAQVYAQGFYNAPLTIIIASGERGLEIEKLFSVSFSDWEILDQTDPRQLVEGELAPDETYNQFLPPVYPILTPEEAWAKVAAGEGSLVYLNEDGDNEYREATESGKEVISFTADYLQTDLAYLETDEWEEYLFPIYIFRGNAKLAGSPDVDNAKFVFYVHALDI